MHLRIVAESYLAMTFVNNISGKCVISGTAGEIINEASKRLNFSYSVTRSPEGVWGSRLPNGSWTGMIGMLLRNESDLSPGPFSIITERLPVFDYSRQLFREYSSILSVINSESRAQNKLDYFLTVDLIVWILLALTTIDTFLLISYPCKSKIIVRNAFSTIEALLLGTFGSKIPINNIRKTLLFLFLLTTSLLRININALYGVNFVLYNRSEGINSIEDLADTSRIIPVIMKNSSFETFFKSGDSDAQNRIWNRMLANERKSFVLIDVESESLVTRIVSGESAYVDILMGLRTLAATICNRFLEVKVRIAKNAFRDMMLSMAFRKGFNRNFQQVFNLFLLKLQESGVYYYWWNKELIENNVKKYGYKAQNLQCFQEAWKTGDKYCVSNSVDIALKVEQLRFAFYTVTYSLLFSMIVNMIEIVVNQLSKKNKFHF